MQVQWYPGHMAKTKRQIKESLKLVDVVVEVLDARIPLSSKNPEVDEITGNKPRIIVLNKSDLADEEMTRSWKNYFEEKGYKVVLLDSIKGKNIKSIIDLARECMKEKIDRLAEKGRISVTTRIMIMGIPNVGKSTIINKLAGKAIAATADKPGVTKANRWIKVSEDVDMMDTPGILWPKFEDERVGLKLAFIGSIKDEILNTEELAYFLVKELKEKFPEKLVQRYGLKLDETEELEPEDVIEMIAKKRGCIMSGGRINSERVSVLILDDFRGIKLGRITLESPQAFNEV